MQFLNRLIPATSSLVVFVILEQLIASPKQIYLLVTVMFVVLASGVFQLADRKASKIKFWALLITPVLLLGSGVLFLSFLEGPIFKQFFILVTVISLWSYLEVVYLWLHFRAKYQAHSLENISHYLNLLAIFWFSSGFLGLVLFLGFSKWIFILTLAGVVALLSYQLVWVNGVN